MTSAARREAVVYLRTTPGGKVTLEEQLRYIQAFQDRHQVQEVARFEDLDTLDFPQLHEAAQAARALSVFVLMNHVDDLERVIACLNAEGVNFVSAQSVNQALFSFLHPPED